MKNFALIGAAGYIAPRHMMAIQKTGNRLVAAVDRFDSVGVIDRYFPEAHFFTEIERFDRFLEKERRLDRGNRVDFISICSPNYLHDAHVRLAMRVHADALCEKPLVVSPWNLDQLAELEQEFGKRVHTVLQLRLHPDLVALKEKLEASPPSERVEVNLTYVTRRGPWYHVSWKGSDEKSGGLAMNIGVHFFDMLRWLFGPVERSEVHLHQRARMAGLLELQRARVRWFLSVKAEDLPKRSIEGGKPAFRSLTIDGEELEFSTVFEDLHVRVYEETLAGRGFGIEDARPSIELVHAIRHAVVTSPSGVGHPWLVHGPG